MTSSYPPVTQPPSPTLALLRAFAAALGYQAKS
jgi:hypothetical protein